MDIQGAGLVGLFPVYMVRRHRIFLFESPAHVEQRPVLQSAFSGKEMDQPRLPCLETVSRFHQGLHGQDPAPESGGHCFHIGRAGTSPRGGGSKDGGIILMSHVGNWEVAVHLLKKLLPEMDLLLYMGIKNKEQIESIQKNELDRAG